MHGNERRVTAVPRHRAHAAAAAMAAALAILALTPPAVGVSHAGASPAAGAVVRK